MAVASQVLVGVGSLGSRTWRQFRTACVVVALAVGCGGVLYGIETGWLACEHRFVENPLEVMMRALGLAHFVVGWIFLFSSPAVRRPAALLRLLGWALLGVLACFVYQGGGGTKSPFILMAFYGIFLVHEVRDEAKLFQRHGEAPPESSDFLARFGWAVALGLMAALAGLHLVHGLLRKQTPILHDAEAWPLVLAWLVLVVAAVATGFTTWHMARKRWATWPAFVADLRPLLHVYLALAVILTVGSLFGSAGLTLIILLHVAVWLVFVYGQLSQRQAPVRHAGDWLRHTPVGFLTLHLGIAGLFLVLFALRVHLWERTGIVCESLSKTSFPYWSLMHICIAFARLR